MTASAAIDVIGDVHGYADQLEALLIRLGYSERAGCWRHPSRFAIFVGDFIDRGPGQLATLNLVRRMIDGGSARAVMGNHEFNAIAWTTRDPDNPGRFLRPRHDRAGVKNRRQHAAYLSEVGEDSDLHREWTDWVMTLPLWIDEPTFRVVHACWSDPHIEAIRPQLSHALTLDEAFVVTASRRGSPEYEAVETLLKGPEIDLPPGCSFIDKDGHERTAIRSRWWKADAKTYRDAYIGPTGVAIPNIPLPTAARFPTPDRPTFVGHYWLEPAVGIEPLSDRVACVDYSVARGGRMAAYRYDGEDTLSADKFVVV